MLIITYASSARRLFTTAELKELLIHSRERNRAENVTGLMLYKDGNFMQALEGPQDAVRKIYSSICADPRHHNVITLIDESCAERVFPSWAMAFKNMNETDTLDGHSDFLDNPAAFAAYEKNPSEAWKLLLSFAKHLRRTV